MIILIYKSFFLNKWLKNSLKLDLKLWDDKIFFYSKVNYFDDSKNIKDSITIIFYFFCYIEWLLIFKKISNNIDRF